MTIDRHRIVSAAKIFQTYTKSTNKLRNMIGASELVDLLTKTDGFLDVVIDDLA